MSREQVIGETFYRPTLAVGVRGEVMAVWSGRGGLTARYRWPDGRLSRERVIASGVESAAEQTPVAIDAAGNSTVVWAADEQSGGGLRVRTRSASGTWSPEAQLPAVGVYRPALAVAADGSAVLTWRQSPKPDSNDTQIAVSVRPRGGQFGPPVVVSGADRTAAAPVVATNDRGDAVVAWIETHAERFSIHAVFRRGSGAFGTPRKLSRIEGASPAVAVTQGGRMVLAWTDNQTARAEARIRSASGRLGAPQIFTRDLGENSYLVALATKNGAIGWSERDPGLSRIRLAVANGAGRLGKSRTVDKTRAYSIGPAFSVTPLGLTVVARAPLRRGDGLRVQQVRLPQTRR